MAHGDELIGGFSSDHTGSLRSITVENSIISGTKNVGGISTRLNTTKLINRTSRNRIENCHADVTVYGDSSGGFASEIAHSTLIRCSAKGSVQGKKDVSGFSISISDSDIRRSYCENKLNAERVSLFACTIGDSKINNCFTLSETPSINPNIVTEVINTDIETLYWSGVEHSIQQPCGTPINTTDKSDFNSMIL